MWRWCNVLQNLYLTIYILVTNHLMKFHSIDVFSLQLFRVRCFNCIIMLWIQLMSFRSVKWIIDPSLGAFQSSRHDDHIFDSYSYFFLSSWQFNNELNLVVLKSSKTYSQGFVVSIYTSERLSQRRNQSAYDIHTHLVTASSLLTSLQINDYSKLQ